MLYTQIMGHNNIKSRFEKAILDQKLSQAYLFYGIEGIGKHFFALEVAKALLCEENKGEPCLVCSSCQKADGKNHPDISLYDVPENKKIIPLETIRSMQKIISFAPMEGNFRVLILNNAHLMNEEASNGFLKTLEEPSPNAIIFLITHSFSALLPTIISRCQRINFPPLSPKIIKDYLLKQNISKDLATLCATSSMGSLKAALQLAEENWIFQRDKICEILLSISRQEPVEISSAFFLFLQEHPSEKRRIILIHLLEIVLTLIRDWIVVISKSSVPLVHFDRKNEIQNFSCYSMEEAVEISEKIQEYKKEVTQNFHVELLLDRFSVDLKKFFSE